MSQIPHLNYHATISLDDSFVFSILVVLIIVLAVVVLCLVLSLDILIFNPNKSERLFRIWSLLCLRIVLTLCEIFTCVLGKTGRELPFKVGVPSSKSLIVPKLAGATPVRLTPLTFVRNGRRMLERSMKEPLPLGLKKVTSTCSCLKCQIAMFV